MISLISSEKVLGYLRQTRLELLDELWGRMSEITTLDFRYESVMKRFVRDRSKGQDRLLSVLSSRIILGGSGSGSEHCSLHAGPCEPTPECIYLTVFTVAYPTQAGSRRTGLNRLEIIDQLYEIFSPFYEIYQSRCDIDQSNAKCLFKDTR